MILNQTFKELRKVRQNQYWPVITYITTIANFIDQSHFCKFQFICNYCLFRIQLTKVDQGFTKQPKAFFNNIETNTGNTSAFIYFWQKHSSFNSFIYKGIESIYFIDICFRCFKWFWYLTGQFLTNICKDIIESISCYGFIIIIILVNCKFRWKICRILFSCYLL